MVTANTSTPPARRCTRCGGPGHQRPSCTATVESGPAAGRRCSKCRQHGHNATSHCKECDEVSPSHADGCSLKPLEYPFRDGPNAVLSEWTGTFTQNRSDCPSSWMDTLYTFFSSILLAVKFVITTERGEREGQLHVHAMVQFRWCTNKAAVTAIKRLISDILFPVASAVDGKVWFKPFAPNQTWNYNVGYIQKWSGQPGYRIRTHNVSDDQLLAARDHYGKSKQLFGNAVIAIKKDRTCRTRSSAQRFGGCFSPVFTRWALAGFAVRTAGRSAGQHRPRSGASRAMQKMRLIKTLPPSYSSSLQLGSQRQTWSRSAMLCSTPTWST